MGRDIFERGKNAIYAVGIFCFAISIPLYILILKIGLGTLLCLPSLADELVSEGVPEVAALVHIMGFIISTAIALGVWAGVGKKAGIITAAILGFIFWKAIVLVVFVAGFSAVGLAIVFLPLFIVCTLYHAVKMFIEYLNSKKSDDPLASCNRRKR